MKWILVCWFRSDASGNPGLLLESAPRTFNTNEEALEYIRRNKLDHRFDHADLTMTETETIT